jgi:hypothetical protein
MRCPKCGGYRFDSQGICLFCNNNMNPITPRKNLGEEDIFKLADNLYDKKIEKPITPKGSKTETCPRCGLPTLIYIEKAKKFECMNKYCPNRKPPTISEDLTDYFKHSHDD